MIEKNGWKAFGYWDGMPYSTISDLFEDFVAFKEENTINRDNVIAHIEGLDMGATSLPIKDIFTGKRLGYGGKYEDGNFTFPIDFLYYYKNYDIGIPPEYEQYLKEVCHID